MPGDIEGVQKPQVHGQARAGLRSVLRCLVSNGVTYEHLQCLGVRKCSLKTELKNSQGLYQRFGFAG